MRCSSEGKNRRLLCVFCSYGSQKAIEVHIYAESMRGTAEGSRPWEGAPNGTMTNGTVGTSVAGVDGPVITVRYKDGEKKIIVTPNVPIPPPAVPTVARRVMPATIPPRELTMIDVAAECLRP
jgi:hypothetical protein